jgi:pentatricopeptide repeat protein
MVSVAFAIKIIHVGILQAHAFQTITYPTWEMFRRHNDHDDLVVLLYGMQGNHHHSTRVRTSLPNSKSLEASINNSIKELEALQRERSSPAGIRIPMRYNSPPPAHKSGTMNSKPSTIRRGSKKSSPNQPKQRLSIRCIRSKPVGSLSPSELRSLCNAIRYSRDESSFSNLEILERILLELEYWHKNVREDADEISGKRTIYLKRIHVFSILTALSNEVRYWKRNDQHRRNENNMGSRPNICKEDVQRLVTVVTLLRELRYSCYIHSDCFNKDVPSFATMIAAEASKYEASAIDTAVLFLDMVELQDDNNEDWDPRIIGAVLDALARYGKAEEAQALVDRAMGLNITSVSTSSRKRLAPTKAGPCYDALIRSWSRRAMILANEGGHDKSITNRRSRNSNDSLPRIEAEDSLARARHILLRDMPELEITITNKTINAVLQGYSALGLGSESESLLMEIESSRSSQLCSCLPPRSPLSNSTWSSILDVGCCNTILNGCSHQLDANNVVCAERLFSAMKKRTPLNLSTDTSVIYDDDTVLSLPFIPPQPDSTSYSSMINCYCKHGMTSKAEELLDEMSNSSSFNVSLSCFLLILQALEVSRELDAPQRVLSLIERSEELLLKPSRLLYVAALKCMKQHGCGEEAEIILGKFNNSHTDHNGPDMYAHMLVLRAWERTAPKSDRLIASTRAESLFRTMQHMANASLLPELDVNAYNCLLNCFARAGEAEKSEELLAQWESSCSNPIQPTSKSYSLVIKALSNSDSADAVQRAWKILIRLGHPNGLTSASPLEQIKIYNSMLRLFAKRGMASEAESLLNTMDEIVDGSVKDGGPDIQSYEAVLEALGRCGDADAPSRAEALVTRLEVMNELSGCLQPSLLAYNSLLNCYANGK